MTKKLTPHERRKFAEQAGVSEAYLYQCLSGRRDMSPGLAIEVERATKGKLKRQLLCQKTYPSIWPNLKAA